VKALQLATTLHAKRTQIAAWSILVADVSDLKQPAHSIAAYRIEQIELDEPRNEIRIVIQYPDEPQEAMSARQFLEQLLPIASDNPDFDVEGSIKVEMVIGGERWERYGMPLRQIVGSEESGLLLLGVEGLKYFAKFEQSK
jgi:hypothetical protein